jgi:rod shape-determining protein MreC
MQKKKRFFPIFLVFFIISLLLFILSRFGFLNGLAGFLENGTVSLQRTVFGFVRSQDEGETARIREENIRLSQELSARTNQDAEVRALRDQFQTAAISSARLLPARVIGAMNNRLIIDQGQESQIHPGSIVVYKDNLVGRVSRTSKRISVIDLVTSKSISLTAKSRKSASLGIIKGQDGGIILDHVVLSEKITKGDLILTKGDIDENGAGFPPDLVVGKTASINKKASNLFQTAEVKSLVDFSKLTTVFIIIQ